MVVLRTGWLAARRFYICMYISNNNLDYTDKCEKRRAASHPVQHTSMLSSNISQRIIYNPLWVYYQVS